MEIIRPPDTLRMPKTGRTPQDELDSLRMSIKRIAERAGLINAIPEGERGWNRLCALLIDYVNITEDPPRPLELLDATFEDTNNSLLQDPIYKTYF